MENLEIPIRSWRYQVMPPITYTVTLLPLLIMFLFWVFSSPSCQFWFWQTLYL